MDPAKATALIEASAPGPGVQSDGLAALSPVESILLDIRSRFSATDHYYHFLLGFLAPLTMYLSAAQRAGVYFVRSCGPMDGHIEAMRFTNVRILSKSAWDAQIAQRKLKVERLLGYDTSPYYDAAAFEALRSVAIERLGVRQGNASVGVLFINRGRSPDYYQSDQAEVKTSANLRRSLPNMAEMQAAVLAHDVPGKLVELETSSFADQVSLFANSSTIVAQHGAALTNMIWMPPKSLIVEINPKPSDDPFVDCFRDLAAICGHNYVVIKQEAKHAAVDPDLVLAALRPYLGDRLSPGTEWRQKVSARHNLAADDETLPLAARPVSRLHQPAWKSRFETTLAMLAQRSFDLVWIGDSIVHQFERPGRDDGQNYRAIWDRLYKPRNAINLGFAGDDTSNVIWRLLNGQIGFASARLVIIEVGTNNFINGKYNAADTVAGLERIVSLVLDSAPKIRVLLLSIVPSGSGTWSGTPQDEANNRLRDAFANSEQVTFVDLTEIFVANGKVDASQYRDTLENPPRRAFHPHAEAQARMAALIEPFVEGALVGF